MTKWSFAKLNTPVSFVVLPTRTINNNWLHLRTFAMTVFFVASEIIGLNILLLVKPLLIMIVIIKIVALAER